MARVRCPACRKPVAALADNPHFPFCSERCRALDAGDWLLGHNAMERPLTAADVEGLPIEDMMAETPDEEDPDDQHD